MFEEASVPTQPSRCGGRQSTRRQPLVACCHILSTNVCTTQVLTPPPDHPVHPEVQGRRRRYDNPGAHCKLQLGITTGQVGVAQLLEQAARRVPGTHLQAGALGIWCALAASGFASGGRRKAGADHRVRSCPELGVRTSTGLNALALSCTDAGRRNCGKGDDVTCLMCASKPSPKA